MLSLQAQKYCVICGEPVSEGKSACSNGHSRFKVSNDDSYIFFSPESQRIRDILLGLGCTRVEILDIISEIRRVVNEANTRVSDSSVEAIRDQIVLRRQQRIAEEKRRQEELEKQREAERQHREHQRRQEYQRRSITFMIATSTLENEPLHVGLDRKSAQQFIYDHLTTANLRKNGTTFESPDHIIHSNQDFWHQFTKHNRNLRRVTLLTFQLTNWFPRTPGLFHTNLAERARNEALRYVSQENGIKFYEPQGKIHMLEGGIGSVRFKPVNIEQIECWLCTATSDGMCHSGIPLAIPNDLYSRYEFEGRAFILEGEVRFLPDFLSKRFRHWVRIPQIYVLVDNIRVDQLRSRNSVAITPMIYFTYANQFEARYGEQSDLYRERRPFRYNQPENQDAVTYVTCKDDSSQQLDRAIEWIERYVDRYEGEIITNFDEQRPAFANVPFSLQNIMTGQVHRKNLEKFEIPDEEAIYQLILNINTGGGAFVAGNVNPKGDFVGRDKST